jgi:hypothetical protein
MHKPHNFGGEKFCKRPLKDEEEEGEITDGSVGNRLS